MALNLNAIGQKIGPLTKEYTWKDTILYALSIGAGYDELEYTYEDRLKVIPTFATVASFDFFAKFGLSAGVNQTAVLHGEQDVLFHNPIPTEGTLSTEGKISKIYDKGKDKGALVVGEAETFHSNGTKLFTNIFVLFCRLDGGFGGENSPREEIVFPERAPEVEEEALPSPNQPLLYRIASGDIYQLHADPKLAKASGFEKPIMHGMCTFGYTCRAVIRHLFPKEPERIKRLRTRFSRPLYPGVPIKTQVWRINEGKALFRTMNIRTGEVVLDRGVVEWEGK